MDLHWSNPSRLINKLGYVSLVTESGIKFKIPLVVVSLNIANKEEF